MFKNEISAVISSQDVADITAAFQTIISKLPPHVALPPEIRDAMLKINVANKEFCKDAINVYPGVKALMPAYIDIAEMQKDLTLFEVLEPLLSYSENVRNHIANLMAVAGSEAYTQGLGIYSSLKTPAKKDMAGAKAAYNVLSTRFAGQGKKKGGDQPTSKKE